MQAARSNVSYQYCSAWLLIPVRVTSPGERAHRKQWRRMSSIQRFTPRRCGLRCPCGGCPGLARRADWARAHSRQPPLRRRCPARARAACARRPLRVYRTSKSSYSGCSDCETESIALRVSTGCSYASSRSRRPHVHLHWRRELR